MFHQLNLAFLYGIILLGATTAARAQQELPPPAGKGPVVVMVSGQSGAARYQPEAQQIAAMGYDVVLIDGNAMEGTHGAALKAAVTAAGNSAHGIAGKVAVVGFSLGGGEALAYASRWPDLVATIVVWYPLTRVIADPPTFVAGIKVPVLMFAGEDDTYKDCCLIDKARALATAATAAGAPLELVSYPNTGHDFVSQGANFNASASADSWKRAAQKLSQYLPH